MQVEVYSGAEKVRLFLNDKLIGEKPTGREQEFRAVFSVPYAPGSLKAEGVRGDRVVAQSVLTTTGEAKAIALTADRTALQADGQDLSFITVEAVDAEGRFQPDANQEVQIAINGSGEIAAVGNGDGQGTGYVSRRSAQTFPGAGTGRGAHVETGRPDSSDRYGSGSERRDYRYPGNGGDSASRTALTSALPASTSASTDKTPAGSHPAISYI